jgi:WD40 repeat protein
MPPRHTQTRVDRNGLKSFQEAGHDQVPREPIEIPPDAVISLRGHFAGVYCGAFTPNGRFLATGSADATAIIWERRDDSPFVTRHTKERSFHCP